MHRVAPLASALIMECRKRHFSCLFDFLNSTGLAGARNPLAECGLRRTALSMGGLWENAIELMKNGT